MTPGFTRYCIKNKDKMKKKKKTTHKTKTHMVLIRSFYLSPIRSNGCKTVADNLKAIFMIQYHDLAKFLLYLGNFAG